MFLNAHQHADCRVILFTFGRTTTSQHRKERDMGTLQSFQVLARQRGFTEINKSGGGTVVWLGRRAPDTARETYQRMCIDSLTKSATIYWMTVPGDLKSRTFRDVPALHNWFELRLEIPEQR